MKFKGTMKTIRLLILGLFALVVMPASKAQELTEPGWFHAKRLPEARVGIAPVANSEPEEESGGGFSLLSLVSPPEVAEAATPEIQALARGLENDPKRIFDYVHDHIRYVHYFGSKKGAQLTLLERSGNDFDQAALLVALLRSAGHTVSYKFGGTYLPYESTDHRDLRHWVGLTKPNTNWTETKDLVFSLFDSRGFPYSDYFNDSTNDFIFHRVWVNLNWGGTNYALDPAFKVSEPVAGINLTTAMGLNTNDLMTAAGGISTFDYVQLLNETNLRNKLRDYTTNLLGYLQSNYPNAAVEEIIGGQRIVSSTSDPLNQPLPFEIYDDGGAWPVQTWSYIPTNLMTSLNIVVDNTNRFLLMPQLQGQRLALTFTTNGLGELWLEDESLLQKQTSGGNSINVALQINHPHGTWDFTSNTLVNASWNDHSVTNTYQRTNSSYAITYAFDVDDAWLKQRQERLDKYRQQGLSDSSREVLTETLNVMGLSWYIQYERIEQLMTSQQDMIRQHHHRFGRMAQEAGRGYYIDVYQQLDGMHPANGTESNDWDRFYRNFQAGSYFGSAAEHGLIEQMQSSNLVAASTVKMLQIANGLNQVIYMLDSNNWASYQASLVNYDKPFLKTNYIDRGYWILLPANGLNSLVSASSWKGFGMVAVGPSQIVMAISGGYNGGYAAWPESHADPRIVSLIGQQQPTAFDPSSPYNWSPSGADPVSMADGSFRLSATDLAVGQATPRGFAFTRSYNPTRRFHNLAGIANGWVHNYHFSASDVTATLPALGDTTPAQMAALIVATKSLIALYDEYGTPKNWVVTALIAKWGVDQLTKNAVSVSLGAEAIQFIKQPDGSLTPPAGSTMTLLKTNSVYWLQERHGNTFKFDAFGRLTNIVDQYNQSLKLTLGTGAASNWVAQVTDWKNNRTLTLNYSGIPLRLASITDGTRTVNYGYTTNAGQPDLTSVTDAENKTSTFQYDTNHQMVAVKDALGHLVTTNIYDDFGRVVTQYTEGDTNKTWQLYWSGFENVEQDPAGNKRRFYYDDKSRLTALRDALGNTSQTFFDGQDHVLMTVSPLGETNRFEFDGRHNLLRSIDPLNFTNRLFYDSQYRLTSTVDARGNTNRFGYNTQHSLVGQTNAAGDWIAFGYNTDGTLAGRTNAGGATTFGYDANGQLNRTTYPGGLGGEGFLNNSFGDVLSHTNARGFVTSFQYSMRRELTNTIAPTNITARVVYDAVGNVQSTTDARGFTSGNTWSASRKLLATALPNTSQGTPITTNVYDNRDWLARTLNPLQQATIFTNDAAQRIVSITDPLNRTTCFAFDANNRKTAATNAALEATRTSFNARGEAVQSVDGASHVVLRAFDAAGNQTALTNRNGKKWQFQFDAANRLTNTITPLNRQTWQVFNNRGLLDKLREPSGEWTTNLYDPKGRLTNITDAVASRVIRYDANNNVTNIIENGKTNAWAFDAYDRVQSYRDADGNLIQYKYDASGNLTNLIYPGNRVVAYGYDSLNRLTNITDWANRKTVISYDLANRVTSITRPNGTIQTNSYDVAGQVTNIWERASDGTPVVVFKFNWNNAARVGWEFAAPLPHAYAPTARTMEFDDDNRLLKFNSQWVTNDADGNLTVGPLTNSTFASYSYDARNRLLGVGGVNYGYDPAGRRIAITNGANITRLVVNPNTALSQVLMRVRAGVTNYYIYGQGLQYEITETASSTNALTYHYDFRGSTVALTDDNGMVTDRIEYSLYATATFRSGTNDTPFLYNGRYGVQTDVNGLLYMRARYYNPLLCRFLNADPSGFGGGLNFYTYADGNPVSMTDPFGLYGNPVAGPDGPVGPSSPYSYGGAFYIPSPQPSTPLGPVGNFVGGVIIGAGVAVVVVVAAPVVVAGGTTILTTFGVSGATAATISSATVTTSIGVAGAYGAYSGGTQIVKDYSAGNWNGVAYGAGTFVGGFAVGVSGGGRAMAEGMMGKPSPAPNTWNPMSVLQYEWSARYQVDYPGGSLPTWMASAPTPASGGASAAGIGAGSGSWIAPGGLGPLRESSSTGKP